jgi:protein-tyrosine phosphatase
VRARELPWACVIDLHCHLLPGLDDGPTSMPEALALASAAAATGTTTIVATPHIDHRWSVRPREIPRRAEMLAEAVREAGIDLEILTAGEIAIERLADLSSQELEGLRLGTGRFLLIESPMRQDDADFDILLLRVHERGEPIVLAHPERCPLFQQYPERLARCVEAGLLCSITAGSLRGDFGEHVRRFALDILREGLAHDVASDAHDPQRRPPGLASALERVEHEIPGIRAQADWLTRLAPAAILAGGQLPARPQLGVAAARASGA